LFDLSYQVFLRSGQLAIYEIHQATGTFEATSARSSSLHIKFVKVVSRAFDIQKPEETEKSILAEQKRVSHTLIPFVTTPPSGSTLSGVFLTGDRPCWILATNTGGIQIHSSGHSVVHSFTACSLWDSKGDFLLYADDVSRLSIFPVTWKSKLLQGPRLLEWIPGFELGTPLPTRPVPRGRSYSNVMFDSSTCLIVAASSLQAQFASFDEDGNKIWEPDGKPTATSLYLGVLEHLIA
jgi:cleavage and polyadenylation specificity factor subunit 1